MIDELAIEQFEERREFERGSFEVVRIGGMTIGRATYQPGWKWSEHVKPTAGTDSCEVEHVGLVVSGRAVIAMDDGTEVEVGPGDFFAVPRGHDSWVVGDEPYISLHFAGADKYASE